MNLPTFQRVATTSEESKSDPPVPRGEDSTLPHEKVQSGSQLLTRTLVDKKEEDFSSQQREISTNILTYTTTEPTHKI